MLNIIVLATRGLSFAPSRITPVAQPSRKTSQEYSYVCIRLLLISVRAHPVQSRLDDESEGIPVDSTFMQGVNVDLFCGRDCSKAWEEKQK